MPKDRLRLARERAGFKSPTEAARANLRPKLNVNTLISHENGNREISRQAANRYAQAFGVKAGWILYNETDDELTPVPPAPVFADVPLVSWISAGQFGEQDAVVDFSDFKTLAVADLPGGHWIALKLEPDANSMNKISPPESIIFVNLDDKRLVANACYVIADETGRATYKRYRPGAKPPFQPASYDKVAPPHLEGAISVIGRVKRSWIDM